MELQRNRPYVIVGRPGCGKTTLARHIFKTLSLDNCKNKFIYTSTLEDWEDVKTPWDKIINREQLVLGELLTHLWEVCGDEDACVVLDDVLNSEDVNEKELELLFELSEKWKITLIVCSQMGDIFTEKVQSLATPVFLSLPETTMKMLCNDWDISRKQYKKIREEWGKYTGVSRNKDYLRAKIAIKFI